jgi:hypothetical protein
LLLLFDANVMVDTKTQFLRYCTVKRCFTLTIVRNLQNMFVNEKHLHVQQVPKSFSKLIETRNYYLWSPNIGNMTRDKISQVLRKTKLIFKNIFDLVTICCLASSPDQKLFSTLLITSKNLGSRIMANTIVTWA